MRSIETSESYQNGNLKIMIYFARFLGCATDFHSIQKKDQVLSFLNTRIKDTEIDPEKRWIRIAHIWKASYGSAMNFLLSLYTSHTNVIKQLYRYYGT